MDAEWLQQSGANMQGEWIFEVLADLRAFALKNDLPALAAQVETTLRVARVELASHESMTPPESKGGQGNGNNRPN